MILYILKYFDIDNQINIVKIIIKNNVLTGTCINYITLLKYFKNLKVIN